MVRLACRSRVTCVGHDALFRTQSLRRTTTAMSSAFIYGTLLHPDVLRRVLGNNGMNLKIAPAVLFDFIRHNVKGCDYPAIAPYAASKGLFKEELDQDQRSVRGTVVSGLTLEDVRMLDVFEGDEYTRQTVFVYPLAPFSPLQDFSQAPIAPEIPLPKLKEHIEVETYVWSDRLERLEPELWSFDLFVQEKLSRWVGSSSSDYAVNDEHRASNGDFQPSQSPDSSLLPEFGHALLPQFCFHKNYDLLALFLGRSLLQAVDVLSREVEANPDKFLRRTYYPMSVAVRERLAQRIGAEPEEVVMVPNATHGINTILRNFVWEANDVLVGTTTTYGAISRTFQYIHDLPPHPALSIMNLTFPVSHATIVENYREHLRSIPRKPGKKVVAVIDAIVSTPGCVLPWEKMVEICREENVWSIVDAAHSIGQQVGINLGKINPDFWISNCNKWLFAKRGCAVLYVPRRNQHIIQSTLPTSFGYVSPEDPPPTRDGARPLHAVSHRPLNFVNQFEYNGTCDVVSYLSVTAALDFRESLGGEERINEYCHALALEGGKRLAQLLQTNLMDEDGSLTANMVNVRLPVPVPPLQCGQRMQSRMEDKLLEEWDCFAAVFIHDNKWWVRCSAQVWNELADFEYLAKALIEICAELRNEEFA